MAARDLSELMVKPGSAARLSQRDPAATPGVSKKDAEKLLSANRERLERLQYALWAENTRSLLIVLQGMDTSGKDGVVRHVIRGMNPEGCKVTSFKKPYEEEAERDFLWRIHRAAPAKGEVAVFNRSHYEDVLIVRVRGLPGAGEYKRRFEQINAFEALLTSAGTRVLKFFLHISKEEQKERLLARLADPEKNWKFNAGDIEERKLWDDYMRAYEDALSACSTKAAPWHVIPADQKWYRNWAISQVIADTLAEMKPRLPKPVLNPKDFVIED